MDYLERYPRQLSGGSPRVAMGRAIVRNPQVFCSIEPLSNWTQAAGLERTELRGAIHQRLKTTSSTSRTIRSAMTMADRFVVMHDGIVEQIGAPLDLYDNRPTCSSPGSSARQR